MEEWIMEANAAITEHEKLEKTMHEFESPAMDKIAYELKFMRLLMQREALMNQARSGTW